jgi:hypothetical protein
MLTRGLYPSEKHDCGKGKKVTYEWMGNLTSGGTAATHKSKDGKYRVGYEHHYIADGSEWYYFGYIFRSWIKFDLSEFVGKPGLVKSAYLRIEKAENAINPGLANTYATCASLLFRLSGPYVQSNCLSVPGDNLAILPHKVGESSGSGNVSEIGSKKWRVDIIPTVRNWIQNPETNHGLLLVPFDERLGESHYGNTHCVTWYRVKLIVEYVLTQD